MATPVTNFGLVTVSTTYDASAVTIVLSSGHGSRLPSTFPYPMAWWNATDYAHPADDPNREIVSVTNRSSDTLTVVRAQEGTSASTKNTASKVYRMSLGITKAMWQSLQAPKSTFQGLQLQTSRDADLAVKQVDLVAVDSIIMDDGVELRNDNGEWSGKFADVSVSGAGGLDAGTEAAFTWYEIWAIAKEDGTRNLLLHASKLWAINTNSVVGEDASQGIRSAVDNSTVKVAQGFKASSGKVVWVDAKLLKVGTPTGVIWFTIETDNAGKPSGTALAVSHAYDVARLPTTALNIRFPMKVSATISSATQYHIVAQGTWTVSATNYVAWRMDGSAGTYPNGSKALFDSDTSTWTTDTDDDMIFAVGLETGSTSVTMPSGYTKKCLLGWVNNDGSSNFVPFLQVDRVWQYAPIGSFCDAGLLTGTATLFDLVDRFPPRDLWKIQFALTGTGTTTSIAAIGDLRSTDIDSSSTTVGAQTIMTSPTILNRPGDFSYVIVQKMGIMAHGTSGAHLWVTGFEW